MLLQTSFPKEPSETIDASTTFDFLVSVYNSNLFYVLGLLGCLRGWRCSISFHIGFLFTFFRFYPWWVVNLQGKFLFPFEGSFLSFIFYFFILFLLYGPQVDPFFYSNFFICL